MKEFIDCDEDKALFVYIENIIAGNKAITQTPEGSIIFTGSKLKISNPFLAIETFEIRYNEKKIDCAYKYEDYIKDKDIQATVKGLGMNPDSFWLLILFCYDYACDVCFTGLTYVDSPKKKIENFISKAKEFIEKESDNLKFKKKTSLTLRMKGKSCTLNDEKALLLILSWIEKGVFEISNDSTLNTFGGNNADEIFTTNIESDSVLIWYFAQLILYFFELNPQFKGRAAKGSGISLNKNILISNLIYHTHLSLNKNFLNDDEYLKGYLKQ
ncbi:hypothetical protein [Bacteroides mediterraneensis]|uniref:DUF4272 domain-containing protein n=1 Tax=Bacteroides mediterraneensis TaxID=1841856 RepID=A0ABS2EX90_9BACE|nr:hypothetical protein [Bacteroides mediterraneensis]MBM6759305.1 hypothetical protein [Bacteroides mediterraneensis]